ncbi:MAG TPA: NAD(P)-dependent alcohol dehydrogenase [Fimbriimonadaceae bacterium]|nr:NAD(P)-dependent alcohol dehydrogenase [Fimbriimonadaceae bacterium]
MKAIVYFSNGSPDVLRCEELDKPTPGDDQVLIRVRAAALNPVDAYLVKKMPAIARKLMKMPAPTIAQPGRFGRDVAGVVEAVGVRVTQFKPGDEVFGSCPGACSEYVCASESKLAIKPANVSFEEAASTPVAIYTALQGLRRGLIKPGHKVLINGASGGVGTFAVQIAKSLGAEVTGVCSTRNLELIRSIGADHVIDYSKEDFAASGPRYDLVFDCAWTHTWSAGRRAVKPGGRYVIIGGVAGGPIFKLLARMVGARLMSHLVSQKFVTFFLAKTDQSDLDSVRDLMAEGKVKPVIDKRYPLSETPDATRYLLEGHARGKVVISVA